MNQHYDLHVSLYLKAPLLSSGGEDAARGLSRRFYRNAEGRLVLQGSHVKGKLKEAMRELLPMGHWIESELDSWFGKDADDHPTLLERARLQFSDFFLAQSQVSATSSSQTRVAIDKQTGTSRENFLLTLETLFPAGTSTEWQGCISFSAADQTTAEAMRVKLDAGLRWIAAIGGVKGSGYGRLEKVATRLETFKAAESSRATDPKQQHYHLVFEFDSDLFVGGLVNKTNFRESQRVIPGAVIKGALARFLNESCGVSPEAAIDETNPNVVEHFEHLARNFAQLRISHAFPAPPAQNQRPVTVPFSAVKDSHDRYFDAALCQSPQLDQSGKAPEFQIDWKDPNAKDADFGWAKCKAVNKTRTRILGQTRTAKAEALYTFKYLSPFAYESATSPTSPSGKIRWIANLTLPEGNPQAIVAEIDRVIASGWRFLGKRQARFKATLNPGHAPAYLAQHEDGLLVDGLAVVSLQTEALLFDAYEIVRAKTPFDVRKLYQDYWLEATSGACEMTGVFFARQQFSGGYVARKFQALAEGNYYPFVLTSAGSVFVLRAFNTAAGSELQKLQESGLPLPQAIKSKFAGKGVPEDQIWRHCPFVPENGFGEININLDWHWQNQFLGQ